MKAILKLLGVVIGFLGITAAFADLLQFFSDVEKNAFAELVMSTKDGIPRSTPGFEKFLSSFPPSDGIDPANVSHIADRHLRIGSESDVGWTVAYVASDKRTHPVARFDQVRDWAHSSIYSWLSWMLAFLGWLIVAVIEISGYIATHRTRSG